MAHPDLDTKPSKQPFDRYPVVAVRLEMGSLNEERFYILEFDLTKDDLGPMEPPPPISEAQARTRLEELGLSEAEIDARLSWAKFWMTTRVLT